MLRNVLTVVVAAVSFALPVNAAWIHPTGECACVSVFSVYPADCGCGRHLPGQWWDDCEGRVSAPAANHAYGHVDNSHKPWSLIPGDGYVGASVAQIPEEGDDDRSEEEVPADLTADPKAATETDQPAPVAEPESLVPAAPAKPEAKEETPKKDAESDGFGFRKDEPQKPRSEKAQEQRRKSVEPPRRNNDRKRRRRKSDAAIEQPADQTGTLETAPAQEAVPAVPVPPKQSNAGLGYGLLGFALLALAFTGHFVRKTWRTAPNEAPAVTI